MFSVGFFFASLGTIIFLFAIKSHERAAGTYFADVRNRLDRWTYLVLVWFFRECAPEALWGTVKRMGAYAAHYGARVMARVAKVLEHRARHVAHRTSHHRIKKQPHYLESVIEEERSKGRGQLHSSMTDPSSL